MGKLDAIVLAFRRTNAVNADNQNNYSALVPVHGKPMLEWIVDMLRGSRNVGEVIVIGPDILENLFCMRSVDRRLSTVTASIENISSIFGSDNERIHDGYLLVFTESIFLTSQLIDKLYSVYEYEKADIAIPTVAPEKLRRYGRSAEATISIDKRPIAVGLLAIVRDSKFIGAALQLLNNVHRKTNLFTDFGPFKELLAVESRLIREPLIRYIEMNEPSVALMVNSANDLETAAKMLPRPYSPPFSKIKVILNPASGKGTQLPSWISVLLGIKKRSLDIYYSIEQYERKIKYYLSELGIKAEMVRSSSSEEATHIAKLCAEEGYDCVIAVGGDGTINSIANGLACTETALAAIPLGTVNLFALQLDLPVDIRSACQLVARGRVRKIDLGKINNRYFSCLCGIGFDAFIINSADSNLKRSLGALAYIISGIRHLIRYSFRSIKLSIDNQPVKRSGYMILVSNGKFYSANMIISPKARIDDGLLDIVIFKNRNIFSLARYFIGFRKGNLIDFADVEYYQGKNLSIEKHGRHFIHTDGEYFGRTPVEISVVPSALKVVC
jgi:diacylglycerol kinase (ATP)